jgi:hypothetical protein
MPSFSTCLIIKQIITGNNEWSYLDGTPPSEDSCLVIDTDAEEHNTGSESDQEQYAK